MRAWHILISRLRSIFFHSRRESVGNIYVPYRPDIDPVALLVIAAVTAAVGVLAAFVPGRRAARMDPVAALRHE